MQGYDATLKLLLQSPSSAVLAQLFAGAGMVRWLNPEVPQVQARRADLLGYAADGQLLHIELQSSNDGSMALRMAEYALAIYRQFGQFPRQLVLYVGEAPMRMEAVLGGPAAGNPKFAFRFELFDFRDLDGEVLLASAGIENNLLAVLARLGNQRAVVRRILGKIAELPEPGRRDALAQFLLLSGLRRLGETVREEARKMPILDDLLSHEVFGPVILEGRRQGLQEGRQEGLQKGRQEVLRAQLTKRFGSVPSWAERRMANLSASELDDIAVRLLDAPSLEALFPHRE